MFVTAGTFHCQAEPDRGGRVDTVDDVFNLEFLGDHASLAVAPVVAVEAGGNQLIKGGLGQQVAG